MEPPRYRFRAGALDHIMRTRRLDTDEQLAAAIGVKSEGLPRLRAGTMVTARLALKVAALQGDSNYLSGYYRREVRGPAATACRRDGHSAPGAQGRCSPRG
ncbi:hypothetical protein [Corynebacterium striatum]|uniref:hypothetical protein n=1 Tax=Corynebacterium striatum TaxID=43770 RepID=UPI003B5C2AAC